MGEKKERNIPQADEQLKPLEENIDATRKIPVIEPAYFDEDSTDEVPSTQGPLILTKEELLEKEKSEEEKKEEKQPSTLRKVMGWVIPIVAALLLAVFIRLFVGGATTVQGQSMEPTLHHGDIILVSKLPTYTGNFTRADVVIFEPPKDVEEDVLYVKRIIALPGETVEIKDQKLFVNGLWMQEFYTGDVPTQPYNATSWTLGENEYFVVGDNRYPGASNDSRIFGPITADEITGVAELRIWPLSDVGGV